MCGHLFDTVIEASKGGGWPHAGSSGPSLSSSLGPHYVTLCSWAGRFTLKVPLSTQVYKWVPANLMLGGNPAMAWFPIQKGVKIPPVASCYRNRDTLRPNESLGSYSDLTLFYN